MKTKFSVIGMSCAACVSRVEKAVSSIDGISDVSVNLLSKSMVVEYSDTVSCEEIITAVKNAGYDASVSDGVLKKRAEADSEYTKTRIVLSFVFLILLMSLSMGQMLFSYPLPPFISGTENTVTRTVLQLALCIPILWLNRAYFIKGYSSLFRLSPNMDSLVAIGSSASVLYGIFNLLKMLQSQNDLSTLEHLEHNLYFEGGAMIVVLITVGKMLEAKSRRKTGEALARLIDMSPKKARVMRDGNEIEIPAESVLINDIVIVRAGEMLPADGEITEGTGEIDEASITGESLPRTKSIGDRVTGTTILKSGYIKFRATEVGEDTVFAKIIELVDAAQSGKAPIARLADKIAGVFVPVVILISIITASVWLILGENPDTALTHAISVLVISCPCALGLATPVAITVATGKGAENGILIKSAEILESLHKTDTVVLDKTGTITQGRPTVTDILPHGMEERELLLLAASIERKSEHILSRAITDKALEENIVPEECFDYETIPGKGIRALWRGKKCIAGNTAFLKENGIDFQDTDDKINELCNEGKTPVFFSCDTAFCGVIAVADVLKNDSEEAIRLLNTLGKEVIMLTGDNRRTAEGIGRSLSLSKIISDVLPEDKEKVIRGLQEEGHRVAMVGDGINDAPALTRANVGLAIGSGTDVARDSADVILIKNSLIDVVDAIRLSNAAVKNIKENLFWAFFYNCLGIPLAAGVFVHITGWVLSPMIAALAMSLSSLFVVSNALRLKRFKSSHKPDTPDLTVKIKGMMCEVCVSHVKEALSTVDGIEKYEVILKEKSAKIWGNPDKTEIKDKIEKAGYKFLGIK